MNRTAQPKPKSALRKPLSDKSSFLNRTDKSCVKKETLTGTERNDFDSVERLLEVKSDLSDLVSQINQLVTQASQQKELTNKGSQEIESFTNVLSDLHSILKPWFPRLQQAFNTIEKDQTKNNSTPYFPQKFKEKGNQNQIEGKTDFSQLESLVSPSPLVSWRAGPCTDFDASKQLFLLTPLQKSRIGPTRKTPNPSKFDQSNLPKTGILKTPFQFIKTPIPSKTELNIPNVGISETLIGSKPEIYVPKYQKDEKKSVIVEPVPNHDGPKIRVSENLDFDFHKKLGFQESPKIIHRKRDVSGILDWFLSPPKTCILMEPSDEKKPANLQLTPCEKNNTKNIENWENDLYMSTAGGKKGEATLKRELWTRFESVSNGPLSFDKEGFGKKDGKGFLDMLQEAEN